MVRHRPVIVVKSKWIVPIADRPILNGWLALDRGRIAAVGRPGASLPIRDDAPLVDLGAFAIMPALANSHVHLELSWLHGQVPRATAFTDWVRTMLERRISVAPPPEQVGAAIDRAIDQMRRSGTGVVGDVSNTLASVMPLRQSPLEGVVFYEVLRLHADGADRLLEDALRVQDELGSCGRFAVSVVPHAPYSVSPQLFQGLRAAASRAPFLPSSVHVAESPEEIELLATGGGQWRALLQRLGAWDETWVPPKCRPVEYLDQMRVLGPRLLAVHGVQCDAGELETLRARGCTLVTCPRSNEYVGVGAPPISRFYRSGVRVAIGTDSLASNDDLNVFAELARMRTLAPDVAAERLLASATWEGARALGFEATAGTVEPGKTAALIAVALPPDCIDVEEYLVSGITPDRVRWVNDLVADCGFRIAD